MGKTVYQFVVNYQASVLTVIADSQISAVDKVTQMLKKGRPYSLDLAGTFDFDEYGKMFQEVKKPKVSSLESMALMLKDNGYKVSKTINK